MIYKHLEGLSVKAEFSDCGKFRYSLAVKSTNQGSGKAICIIMQNPSEANSEQADKSVQFLEKLVFRSGYKEFSEVTEMIIVNQFAYIQKKEFMGSKYHIGPDNDAYIWDAVQKAQIVLIAWGKNNNYEDRQNTILAILKSAGNKKLYKTKKHPSRGHYKDFIERMEYPNTLSR